MVTLRPTNEKAARIAPERLLLIGTGALHPVGLSSSALACPGAAWSESRREFEKPARREPMRAVCFGG